jgi:hypothetical protein
MLRHAFVVGIAGWLCAQEPVPTPPSPAPAPAATPTPRAQAEQFVRELAEPGKQNAAVAGLVALGDAAVPALHKALTDRRSDVLQWALFACSGLRGDCASLRAPVERLLASKDLGIALMARRAWQATEGRNGLLLTLDSGEILLVQDDSNRVLCKLSAPDHTELLPNGNLLVASVFHQSVREVGIDGTELWTKLGLKSPVDCELLPNGNRLVCCFAGQCVCELQPNGEVAWSIKTEGKPVEADRLANGNTLITQFDLDRGGVVEVDRDGKTVWSFAGSQLTSASRQLDGTTLVTESKRGRVRLVKPSGEIQRTWTCDTPGWAELLPSGHLLVNEGTVVRILDAEGNAVWTIDRPNRGMHLLGAGPSFARPPGSPEPVQVLPPPK